MSGRGWAADWESPAPPASFRQTSRWQVSGGQRAICAARPPTLSQALRESRARRRGCPSAIGVLLGGCGLALAQSLGCGLWAVSPLAMQGCGWTIGLPAPPIPPPGQRPLSRPRYAPRGLGRQPKKPPSFPSPGPWPSRAGLLLGLGPQAERLGCVLGKWAASWRFGLSGPVGGVAAGPSAEEGRWSWL